MADYARNNAVVKSWFSHMAAGDVDAVLELASEDIVVTQANDVPWGGRFEGRIALGLFANRVGVFIDSEVVIEAMIPAGDEVAVIGFMEGRTVKGNQLISVEVIHLFTIQDGLVTKLHVVIDTPVMLKALAAAEEE